MAYPIDSPLYATLAGYTVFASIGINFGPNTILTGGVYGSNPINTISGYVNGVLVTTGNNPVGDVDARSELFTLYFYLTTLSPDFTTLGSSPSYSFEPGVYNITNPITFLSTDSITFTNTSSVVNPKWIFNIIGDLSFNDGLTIDYTAAPDASKSIYWVTKGSNSIFVSSTNPLLLKGIIISGQDIDFSGLAAPRDGAAYAGGNSSTSGLALFTAEGVTINGLGFPAICFPGNTPINTDQGIIPISKIIAGINTINNKRIVAVTRTREEENTFVVCFKKNSLGENIPNEDTIVSKYHSVEYKNEMIEAHKFLEQIENVVKLEYKGEMMYNILMDKHEKIIVNNLICETLHPDNPYAKKYNTPNVTEINIPTIEIECV